MRNTVGLLDTVALTVDLPEHGLCRGQVGTVVEFLAHGHAFEVEFSDSRGHTYKSLGLRPEQIRVIYYESSAVHELTPADTKGPRTESEVRVSS